MFADLTEATEEVGQLFGFTVEALIDYIRKGVEEDGEVGEEIGLEVTGKDTQEIQYRLQT